MTDEKSAKTQNRRAKWRQPFLVILLVCAILVGLLWIFRAPVASSLITQWCARQNITCQLEVTKLSPQGFQARNISLGTTPTHRAQLDGVKLDIKWAHPLSPSIDKVQLTAPLLQARYKDGTLDFYGLEALLPEPTSSPPSTPSGTPLPALDIRDLVIELETDAGTLIAKGRADGRYPANLQGEIAIVPTQLTSGENRLDWSTGTASIKIHNGQIDGTVKISLEQAKLEALRVGDLQVDTHLLGNLQRAQLGWMAKAGDLQLTDLAAQNIISRGEASLSNISDLTIAGLTGALHQLTFQLRTDTARHSFADVQNASLVMDLNPDEDHLEGSLALRADTVSGHGADLKSLALTGNVKLAGNDAQHLHFQGAISSETGAIHAQTIRNLWTSDTVPAPLTAHASAFTDGLVEAAKAFRFGVDFELSGNSAEDWNFKARRPVSLESSSGFSASITPFPHQAWLELAPGRLALSGALSLSGGGLPNLQATLDKAHLQNNTIDFAARGVELSDWTAAAGTLFTTINSISYNDLDGTPSAYMNGEVGLEGRFETLQFGRTTLFGTLQAARGEEGWRVQTAGQDCLGLTTRGITTDALSLGGLTTSLCPEDGRFVRHINGVPGGTISLGDITLPFRSNETTGALNLKNAHFDWMAGSPITVDLEADTFDLPLIIADEGLQISSQTPRLVVGMSDGPITITAALSDTEFSGSLIPASARAERLTATIRTQSDGLAGRAEASTVRISDPGVDPLYRPLIAELSADISAGTLFVSGPIQLAADRRQVAETNMFLDLATLNGAASVRTGEISFSPEGLQPRDISDLLRGELTDATGSLSALLNFQITAGTPSGTADIALNNLDFQTVAFDRVTGVNGALHFDDIFALTTPPGQTITINTMNPGLPLNNGELRFQLLGADAAQLEAANWPFAGGTLVIQPTRWELDAARQTVTAGLESVELTELIEALKIPDTYAEGTVSGLFPIDIAGADIFIRDASLKVDEEGGTLKYLGGVTEQAGQANPFAEQAFQALKDFRFTVMEVGANGNLIDEITVNLRLEGMNPDVLEGTEFVFNIGITSKLAQLLQSLSFSEATDFVTQSIIDDVRARNEAPAE